MQASRLFLLFLLIPIVSFAQKEANIWYFGVHAGLDFNSGNPVVLTDGQVNTIEGCATISDSNGSLLFYTDGITIWNRNHTAMPNGTGLLGDPSSSQSGIIVPKPGTTNIFYVFTVDQLAGLNGLSYSEVDMSLEGGQGDVTSNKNINLLTPTTEKISAISHANGNDIWVVTHDWDTNNFYSYLVSPLGVSSTPQIWPTGDVVGGISSNAIGVLKISPDGTKLAICSYEDSAQLFDFNTSTGEVSNPRTLRTARGNYGAEFSSSSEILYITNFEERKIYQYDLLAPIISDSEVLIYESTYALSQLQLGPDGKIYVANFNHNYLDVINTPNRLGLTCDYVNNAIFLESGSSTAGLPPFIQSYFFTTSIVYDATCFGDMTSFSLATVPDSVVWDFGDLTSGTNNTSTLLEPTHVFTSPGTYTVTATATSGTDVTTETETITIYEVPAATQPTNMEICDTNNDGLYAFNLTSQDAVILSGQSSGTYSVEYFASMQDYTNNNPIANPSAHQNTTAYTSQTIIAKVSNQGNHSCEATTSFTIHVYESPTPQTSTAIPDLTDCDNATVGTDTDGFIQFNLTDREAEILNGQFSADFEIMYYTDQNLTQQIVDPTIFVNASRRQEIFCAIQNRLNSTCNATTSFFVEVFELPILTNIVSIEQCDDDTDGFSAFNLTEVEEEIITNPANYTITYHESIVEANANTAAITNITAYVNEVVSSDKVWARVENANGCYRVSEANLVVSTTQIPNTISLSYYECDNGTNTTDGIATFDFSAAENTIRNIFPVGQQLLISYFQTEADAYAETNAIADISNYQNTNSPNQQTIYVRVDSAVDNDCLGLGGHINLFVDTVPVANPVTVNPECDNDRDGLFAFDTSSIQNAIVGSQTNVAVRYTDANGATLPSPLPNPFVTASQTITARITNTNAQDPNGQCYDETQIVFIVNNVPIANPVTVQEACDDDFDGMVGFDTSTIEPTLLGTQTGMVVRYFDTNGTELPSPLPNPFMTVSQDIRVRIENPQYAVCYEETIVSFVVREKPDFELQQEEIICMTATPNQNISIQNPTGNFTYTWTDSNSNVISNNSDVTVTSGGVYSVFATSIFGCNSEVKSITVMESSIAQITRNDIEVIDDSANNSIRVVGTDLGFGDYEFQLVDENNVIVVDYQSNPSFMNLEGGVYILNVRDRNGCGEISFEISLLSFPPFFTPNNDGINDTWQIKGVTSTFYSEGSILIFNRYGKRVGTFTINDTGWNGLYGGRQLPPNDYWFSVRLLGTNGTVRTKKGHFSLLRK